MTDPHQTLLPPGSAEERPGSTAWTPVQNLFVDAHDEWELILTRNDSKGLGAAYRALYSSIGVVSAFLLGRSVSDVGNSNPVAHADSVWGSEQVDTACEVYQALLACNFVATLSLMLWALQIAAQLAQTPDDKAKGLLTMYGFHRVQGAWLILGLVVVLFLSSVLLKLSIACSRTVFLVTVSFAIVFMTPLAWQTRSVVVMKQDYLRGLVEQTN